VQGFMPTLARPEVDVLDGLTTAIIVDQQRMGADVRSTVGSNGVATPVWDHPSRSVDMSSGSTTKAVVSPLSNDGTEFTVSWMHR
jgi:hypothetical protein